MVGPRTVEDRAVKRQPIVPIRCLKQPEKSSSGECNSSSGGGQQTYRWCMNTWYSPRARRVTTHLHPPIMPGCRARLRRIAQTETEMLPPRPAPGCSCCHTPRAVFPSWQMEVARMARTHAHTHVFVHHWCLYRPSFKTSPKSPEGKSIKPVSPPYVRYLPDILVSQIGIALLHRGNSSSTTPRYSLVKCISQIHESRISAALVTPAAHRQSPTNPFREATMQEFKVTK